MRTSFRITWHCEGADFVIQNALKALSRHYDVGFTVTVGQGIYDGRAHRMHRIEHVMPHGEDVAAAHELARNVEHYLKHATSQDCVMPVIDRVEYSCTCGWEPAA